MTSSAFTIELTREAEKDLDRLRGHRDRVTRSLRGARSLEFSLPGGAYRAVYIVLDEERICIIFIIGSHENVYKRAERRYQALKRTGQV